MPIEGELTPPDDSLRSDIEAAFAGGGDEHQGGTEAAETPARSDVGADNVRDPAEQSSGTETSADGRIRDPETGKFIPKPAAEIAAKEIPSTDAAKASTEASPAAAAPPAGWTAAEKAEWAKLPPAIQAAVSRRELEMSNGGQRWSEEKRRYEAALAPVAEAARRNGLNTEAGLKALLDAQSFLERDPANAIRWLAQAHNVNIATLAGQNPDEVPQQPDIAALVRQAVMPYVAPIQQRWQADEQRQQEMTVNAIHAFASSPGHEHYNSVEGTIALILPQVIEENPSWSNEQKLQEAYDRALYATPATRQQVLAAKERSAEETRRTEAAARATKARGAAVSVTGSPQGTAASEAAPTLREEIMRAMTG